MPKNEMYLRYSTSLPFWLFGYYVNELLTTL